MRENGRELDRDRELAKRIKMISQKDRAGSMHYYSPTRQEVQRELYQLRKKT